MHSSAPDTGLDTGLGPRRARHPVVGSVAIVLACCALAWSVTAASLLLVSSDRDPRIQTFSIPEGASALIAAGENPLALPPSLALVAGDTLRFENHDGVDHLIGSWTVRAGSTRDIRFARPVDGSFACSVHPAGRLGIEVRPRGLDLGLTVLPTLLLGPGVAAVILGVRSVMRRLGDDEDPGGLTTRGTASGR